MRRGLGFLLGVALTAASTPSALAVDFGFSEYTYGTNNCTVVKDPMNVYYKFDLGATLWRTENILGWTNTLGTDQWFSDLSFCQKQNHQRASGFPATGRNHTRLNWSSNEVYTASPMHHDSFVWCGGPNEKADSFNSARDFAKNVYQGAGYFATYTYTGNTLSIQQCDGSYTASDGYYLLIRT